MKFQIYDFRKIINFFWPKGGFTFQASVIQIERIIIILVDEIMIFFTKIIIFSLKIMIFQQKVQKNFSIFFLFDQF